MWVSKILFSHAHRLQRYSTGGYVQDRESLYLVNLDGTGLQALPVFQRYSVSSDGNDLLTLKLENETHVILKILLNKLLNLEMRPLNSGFFTQ